MFFMTFLVLPIRFLERSFVHGESDIDDFFKGKMYDMEKREIERERGTQVNMQGCF